MKKYIIFYNKTDKLINKKSWEIESDMGLMNVLIYFQNTMCVDYDHIESFYTEKVAKDSLIELLDNNPSGTEELPKQELTKREKELIWLADLEATQRYEHESNGFHL